MMKIRVPLGMVLASALCSLMCSCSSYSTTVVGPTVSGPVQHILFVGDSFTHGRYTPVRLYNNGGTQNATLGSILVVDDNFGATGARAEVLEAGPYGGIPGFFSQFAFESGLNYDVHIDAISSASLTSNYAAASSVIAQSKWNAVVLQELSTRPITHTLSGDSTSNPSNFCSAVKTIESGVHAVAPSAKVYLEATWAPASIAIVNSGSTPGTTPVSVTYAASLEALTEAYHNVYNRAAVLDGSIEAVIPVGDAWSRAWSEGIANSTPFATTNSLPILWYGNQANTPTPPSTGDNRHPNVYGAYLTALVLFQQITGTDVRKLGANETTAAELDISPAIATQLQTVAWESVTQESSTPINQTVDPCSLTN